MTDIVERLRRRVQVQPPFGGGSVSIGADGKALSSTSYITDDGMRLANPDGPPAASLIEQLRSERDRLREALGKLSRATEEAIKLLGSEGYQKTSAALLLHVALARTALSPAADPAAQPASTSRSTSAGKGASE